MSLEEKKKLANLYHQDVICNLNYALADKIIAPDCIFHGPNRDARHSVRGPEQGKRIAINDDQGNQAGYRFEHDPIIAEGNLIAFVWRVIGVRVTGETSQSMGVDIIRLENDKVAEVWFAAANPRLAVPLPAGYQW